MLEASTSMHFVGLVIVYRESRHSKQHHINYVESLLLIWKSIQAQQVQDLLLYCVCKRARAIRVVVTRTLKNYEKMAKIEHDIHCDARCPLKGISKRTFFISV